MPPFALDIPDACPVCHGGPIRLESGHGRTYSLNADTFVSLDLPWEIPVCRSCASVAVTPEGARLLTRALRGALWREARQATPLPSVTEIADTLRLALQDFHDGPSPSNARSWTAIARDHLEERQSQGVVIGSTHTNEEITSWAQHLLDDILALPEGEVAPFRLPGAFSEAPSRLS